MNRLSPMARADEPPAPPRPMFGVTLALIAGISVGLALPWPWQVWGWMVAIPAAAGGVMLYRSRRIRGPAPPSGGLLLVAVAGAGCLLGSGLERGDRRALDAIPAWDESGPVQIEGTLDEEPRALQTGYEFVLSDAVLTALGKDGATTRSASLQGRIAIQARQPVARRWPAARSANLKPVREFRLDAETLPLPGQRMRATGRFHRADAVASSPGLFDNWRYLRSRGIFATVNVNDSGALEIGPASQGFRAAALSLFRDAREWMAANLGRRLAGDELALARAILLGEATQIDPANREAFSRVGLAHLLAVSGLHTGFILLLILGLGRVCRLSARGGALFGIIGLLLYAGLTGFRPPVVRAATMGTFVLFGFAIGRTMTSLASVATAAFTTLIWDPRNLLRLDWQLSYGCAISIIVLTPPLRALLAGEWDSPLSPIAAPLPGPSLPVWRRWADQWLMTPASIVLATMLGLFPLQLYYFSRINLLNVPANLIGVPLSMFSVFGAAATAFLGRIPFLGAIPGFCAHACLALLLLAVHLFDQVDIAVLNMRPLPLWSEALFYLLLFSPAGLLSGRGRRLRFDRRQRASLILHPAACIAVLCVAPLLSGFRSSGWLDFYALDVGQGDGLVVRFPNGRVMVIDAGTETPFNQGRTTVAPFLQTLGVSRIDCMVASHADADHIGGLPYLIEHFDVGAFLAGPDLSSSHTYAELQAAIAARHIRTIPAHEWDALQGFGGVKVDLLGPLPGRDDNDASIAMLIEDGGVKILTTGDLTERGESQMLAEGSLTDIDVLKVGHHGSRYSTSDGFLDVVRPEVALISVGARNTYGHPAPETIERLQQHGAAVFRTDQSGTLWVRTDGHRIETYAYAGQ